MDHEIVGVFASSELCVEPAGVVADLHRLPGVGLRASKVCRNKLLQRHYLRAWSPPSVPARAGEHDAVAEALDHRFPVVAKPLNLYCSIGVQVLADLEALEAHLAALGPGDSVLVEEYVTGRELSVESIVAAGETAFSSVTQKATNEHDGDYFVEMGHTVPAGNVSDDEADRILAVHRDITERLELGTGMTHGEYRIRDDGTVVLMEIAARPPGDGLLQLYHLATGASIEAAMVAAALGGPVSYPQPVRWARQVYFEHDAGSLLDVSSRVPGGPPPSWVVEDGLWPVATPAGPGAPPGLRHLLVLKDRGAPLGPITDSFGRAVTALFDAPTPADLDAFELVVRAGVDVTTG
ncbi:MAG TPA: ATP-grasp domain-containing protein [Acidimicrobiales bacterium]